VYSPSLLRSVNEYLIDRAATESQQAQSASSEVEAHLHQALASAYPGIVFAIGTPAGTHPKIQSQHEFAEAVRSVFQVFSDSAAETDGPPELADATAELEAPEAVFYH
jgi:hypothetical protein